MNSSPSDTFFAAERSAILDALPAHIALLDRDGRIVAVNEAWRRFASANVFPGTDFAVGQNYLEVCDRARGDCSEEAGRAADGICAVLGGESAEFAIEYPCHGPSERRWFRMMATPVEDAGTGGAVVMHINITDRKCAELLQEAEARILESISSGMALPTVLNDIALVIEDSVPDARASILLLDPDGKRLRFGAAPHLPEAFNRAIDGLAVDPASNECGVCGTAAHRRHPVIVVNVETDPLCKDFRELAREHGIGACWSMPVLDRAGNVSATFAVYFDAPRVPEETELAPFARMAHLVGIAVERNRDAEALRASEERFRGTFRDATIGISITDTEGRYLEANAAYCRMLGYTLDELRTMDFPSLTHPDDRPENMKSIGALLTGEKRGFVIEKRYLPKGGGVLWCRLSVSVNRDAAGRPANIVAVAEDISERKRAEEELKHKESLLHIAGKISRFAGWAVDAKDRRILWSDELCEILDIPQGEAPTIEEGLMLYLPESRKRIAEALGACLQDGTPFDLELETFTAKRRRIWVRCRGEADRDEHGVIRRAHGAFQDITERKLADEGRRETEQRFRQLAETIEDVFWLTDPTKEIMLYVSPAFERIWGRPVRDIYLNPRLWLEAIHEDDRSKVIAALPGQIEGKYNVEYRIVRPDGTIRWIADRGYPVRDESGRVHRVAGSARDITERKGTEEKLADQAALLDVVQDAIFVRSLEYRILFWNKGAERIYGWTAQEAVGRLVEELLFDDPTEYRAAAAAVLAEGQWAGRLEQRRKDKRKIIVESRGTLMRDARGYPRSVFSVNTDITERLALEEQLRQSQRLEAVGQLTGGIAHDFNNLLTVILGNAELLTERLSEDNKLRTLAEMTKAAARRGADLTQRLLAFSRRQALEPKAVDVNRLLGDMDGLLRRTLTESISIELPLGDGLWDALIDPAQLENAILNICINARDAMNDGGDLTIETANAELDAGYADSNAEVVPGKYVMIAITDTGTGIPPDVMGKVFDPFFTTKEQGKGTGLGLSMVYGFVKQSGGHVKIYSEVGQGTTVKIYLPRAVGQDMEGGEKSVVDTTTGGSETILMVEDDEMVREHVEGQLRALGYRVLTAGSGPEAMDIFREEPGIDLLFTDVIMPGGMNGKELADAVRQIRPEMKVLFTSGYAETAIVHQGRLDPGVLLLSKPYRHADLARMIRVALDRDKEPPS